MPLKRVVQPKPLKEISFRKAEYGKPMTSSKSTAVTPSLSSLPKTPTADIEDPVSEVQCSVSNSGISQFWVTPETQEQEPRSASELGLEAAAQSLIVFSSRCFTALSASATELADANASAPYYMELCEAYMQEQTIFQDLAEYIHATTKDQVSSILWLDLRNGCFTSSMFTTVLNRRTEMDPSSLITRLMGCQPFTAVPPAIKWVGTMRIKQDATTLPI